MTGPELNSLAEILYAALRRHPHLGNVLTHIAAQKWQRVEEALGQLLDPSAEPERFSPVARNLLELICDNRGTTGRILQPFFFGTVAHVAGEDARAKLETRLRALRALAAQDVKAWAGRASRREKTEAAGPAPAHLSPLDPGPAFQGVAS